MRSSWRWIVVAGSLAIALGSAGGLAAGTESDVEVTGLWSGTDTYVQERETNTTTYVGEATIERRGDVYTLAYEISNYSQNHDHDSCFTTSITTGGGSTTPEDSGRLLFVGEATTDIVSDCRFYEASGGVAQEVGERSTVGYLMDGDVIRLDLLPATHMEMQPQMAVQTDEEWGIVIDDDGNLDLIPPPDGVLSISRSDLPEWAAEEIVTVGAMVVHVGPPDVVTEGDPRVLIDGVPAVRVGDPTGHGGQIVSGSDRIRVNGVPAAIRGSQTVCPAVTGTVPHVGGPIPFAGTPDAYRLLTDPEYQEQARLLAEVDFLLFEMEKREQYGFGYGMALYDILYIEREIAEQNAWRRARGVPLIRSARWGSPIIEGDYPDVQVGDGIVIGGDPSDVGIVVDKGSLVLDRPLQHDHPAGTPLLVVPAELVEQARAQMAEAPSEATTAVEPGSDGLIGARVALAVGLPAAALLAAAMFVIVWRRRRPVGLPIHSDE